MEGASHPGACRTHHAPVGEHGPHCHGQRHARTPGEPHAHPAPHTHALAGTEGHRPQQRHALAWSIGLSAATMVAEIVGGLWTGSLMLLSDAAHMLSHVVALTISYFAIWMAARPRTARSHYGLHRSEILASFLNGLGLLVLTGAILFESLERLRSPVEVRGLELIAVATLGLVVNVITAVLLGRTGAEDLNTRSALLHMLGDLFSSVVIVVGGVVLWRTGWTWIDPALSILVALVVLWWAFGLLRSSASILLERAPEGIEPAEVRRAMCGAPGVRDVHDLHVWEITSGYVCLTAHVVVENDARVSEAGAIREKLCDLLWQRYHVAHVTLQLEAPAA